jgi:hypothetical protein
MPVHWFVGACVRRPEVNVLQTDRLLSRAGVHGSVEKTGFTMCSEDMSHVEKVPHRRFLPGFQRFRKVFAELLAQRIGVISLPGSARRAGALARAAALSDWLFCLGIKAVCGGGGSD